MKKLIVFISTALISIFSTLTMANSPLIMARICNETVNHGGSTTLDVHGYDQQGNPREKKLMGTANHPCTDMYYNTNSHGIHITGVGSESLDIGAHSLQYPEPQQTVCDVQFFGFWNLYCKGW